VAFSEPRDRSKKARAGPRRAHYISVTALPGRIFRYKSSPMADLRNRPLIFGSLPLLVLLGGCDPGPQCDSPENRDAVLQSFSGDRNNALARFVASQAEIASPRDAAASAPKPDQPPTYLLDQEMVTLSTSDHQRTLKCSGVLSASIGDTSASKEFNFTVRREADGKITISVEPFQF
jgi:hypothetical protein